MGATTSTGRHSPSTVIDWQVTKVLGSDGALLHDLKFVGFMPEYLERILKALRNLSVDWRFLCEIKLATTRCTGVHECLLP